MTDTKTFDLSLCDAGFFALKQLLIQDKKVLNINALFTIINTTIANADKDDLEVICDMTHDNLFNMGEMVSKFFKTLIADEGSLIIYVKKENTTLKDFENALKDDLNPVSQNLLQKYADKETKEILDSKKNTLTPMEKKTILLEAMQPESWQISSPEETSENVKYAQSL